MRSGNSAWVRHLKSPAPELPIDVEPVRVEEVTEPIALSGEPGAHLLPDQQLGLKRCDPPHHPGVSRVQDLQAVRLLFDKASRTTQMVHVPTPEDRVDPE